MYLFSCFTKCYSQIFCKSKWLLSILERLNLFVSGCLQITRIVEFICISSTKKTVVELRNHYISIFRGSLGARINFSSFFFATCKKWGRRSSLIGFLFSHSCRTSFLKFWSLMFMYLIHFNRTIKKIETLRVCYFPSCLKFSLLIKFPTFLLVCLFNQWR
mgnify:CR=1 FL=1